MRTSSSRYAFHSADGAASTPSLHIQSEHTKTPPGLSSAKTCRMTTALSSACTMASCGRQQSLSPPIVGFQGMCQIEASDTQFKPGGLNSANDLVQICAIDVPMHSDAFTPTHVEVCLGTQILDAHLAEDDVVSPRGGSGGDRVGGPRDLTGVLPSPRDSLVRDAADPRRLRIAPRPPQHTLLGVNGVHRRCTIGLHEQQIDST